LSFEVVEEHTNSLLGRREAKLVVHHEGAGTPDRLTVRKLASEHFKAPVDRVFVKSIATRTGGSSATCMVEIYQDAKSADIVPAYLKNRMLPKDQRVAKVKKEPEPKPPRRRLKRNRLRRKKKLNPHPQKKQNLLQQRKQSLRLARKRNRPPRKPNQQKPSPSRRRRQAGRVSQEPETGSPSSASRDSPSYLFFLERCQRTGF